MERSEIVAYKAFRDSILEGNLRIVRHEMLVLLSKLYIYQLVKVLTAVKAEVPNIEALSEEILGLRRDFQDFAFIGQELNKAIEIFQCKDTAIDAKLKKFKELQRSEGSSLV